MMKAVSITRFGGPEVLQIAQVPIPSLKDSEVLIQINATALNRADLLQRKGRYPSPPGASEILGLEFAGQVVNSTDK